MRTRDNLHSVAGAVNADGGIRAPGTNDWVVSRTAAGIYTITFLKPFKLAPVGSLVGILYQFASMNGLTSTFAVVNGFNPGNSAAADAYFYFIITGILL